MTASPSPRRRARDQQDAPPAPSPPQGPTIGWRPSVEFIRLLSRFGLVGLANTALGFGIIAALDVGLGVERHIANAVGYGAGMILSYVLNRTFVFRSRSQSRSTVPRFLASLLIAFCLNQAVLFVAASILGDGTPGRLLAQLVAMASYTCAFFLLCKLWVFRERGEVAESA